MSWRTVYAPLPCSFCPTVITAGRWARFSVHGHQVVWCPGCAKTRLLEDPPALPVAEPPPAPSPKPVAASPEQPALFETEPIGRPKLPTADAWRLLEEARKHVGASREQSRFTTAREWFSDVAAGGQQ
jgi:hypothetical protein